MIKLFFRSKENLNLDLKAYIFICSVSNGYQRTMNLNVSTTFDNAFTKKKI